MVISSEQGITVAAGRDSPQPKKNTRAKRKKDQQRTSRVIAVVLVMEAPRERGREKFLFFMFII